MEKEYRLCTCGDDGLASTLKKVSERIHASMMAEFPDYTWKQEICNLSSISAQDKQDQHILVVADLPSSYKHSVNLSEYIVRQPEFRFLLSNPNVFFVFFCTKPRKEIDAEILNWLSFHAQRWGYKGPETSELISRSILGKSFISSDELGNERLIRQFVKIWVPMMRTAIFDPTGVRRLLHFLLSKVSQENLILPPQFMVLADDNPAIATYYSSLFFRLGYSVFWVQDSRSLLQVQDCFKDLTPPIWVVDQLLNYDDWEEYRLREGSEFIQRLGESAQGMIITGGDISKVESAGHSIPVLKKPILDHFHLCSYYAKKTSGADLQKNYKEEQFSDGTDHQVIVKELRSMAERVIEQAEIYEKNDEYPFACICYYDAYDLCKGRDGTQAAGAYMKLQELETVQLCRQLPLVKGWKYFEQRYAEIEEHTQLSFVEDKQDQGVWWKYKILKTIQQIINKEFVSTKVQLNCTLEVRKARAEILLLDKRYTQAFSLKSWNLLSKQLDSVGKLLLFWLLTDLLMFCVYYFFGGICDNTSIQIMNMGTRAGYAAMSGGLGMGVPPELKLCLMGDPAWPVALGVLHSMVSLILVGALIDHLIQRYRDA